MLRFSFISLLILFISACHPEKTILSEEEFSNCYLDSLKGRYPAVNFRLSSNLVISSKTDDLDFKHYLENAYKAYLAEPDSLTSIIQGYLATTADIYAEKKAIAPESIVPVIKPVEYLDEVKALAKKGDDFPIVTSPYNDQLMITYAVDSKNSVAYLSKKQFESLGISMDTLKVLAVRNLDKMLQSGQMQKGYGIYMVTAGGAYEACMILLTSFWTKKSFPVEGDIIIAIPNRDILLVTGSKDAEGMKNIKEISADYYKTGNYRISPYLYKWTGKTFEKYDDSAI